jgi:hypothetical protein
LIPVTICTGLGFNENLRFQAQKDRLATLMKYAQVTDEDFFTEQLAYAIFGLATWCARRTSSAGTARSTAAISIAAVSGSTATIDARIPRVAPDLFARQLFAQKSLPARIGTSMARRRCRWCRCTPRRTSWCGRTTPNRSRGRARSRRASTKPSLRTAVSPRRRWLPVGRR